MKILNPMSLAAVAAFTLGACGTTGTERASATVNSTEALGSEFTKLKTDIDEMMTSLDAVVASKDGNLSKAYGTFDASFSKFEEQGERVVDAAAELKSNAAKYIDKWQEQMAEVSNPEIRKIADERRAAAEKQFDEAKDELARIRKDYDAFFADVKGVKTALDNDLNAAGVAALAGVIENSKAKSQTVTTDIDGIVDALEKMGAALAASAPEKK